MEKLVSLEVWRSFLAVVDHSSVRRAAKELNKSQPCVSLNLRALEKKVGQRLFDRTTEGTSLTEAGAKLVPWARELVHVDQRLNELLVKPQQRSAFDSRSEQTQSQSLSSRQSAFRDTLRGTRQLAQRVQGQLQELRELGSAAQSLIATIRNTGTSVPMSAISDNAARNGR